jgi:hypothetical protein
MLIFHRILIIIFIYLLFCIEIYADTNVDNISTAIAQANNPLANLKAFNVQNYYYSDISGFNTTGDIFWLRYAQPIDNFLIRASLPIQTFPVTANGARQTGTGDFNIFATYLLNTKNPQVSFGIGSLLVAPTASPSSLGAGKWQGGVAIVYFNATSNIFQYGELLTYQADFAGNQSRLHTSIAALQPFAILQIGKGYYLRSAPIWTDDFINHTGVIPLSLGIGKVFKKDKTVYNIFIEPQIAVWHQGIAQPLMQIYAGLNIQFYS